MITAMTPDEFMNIAIPWIVSVAVVIWIAVILFSMIFGKDDEG
jgi:hypothetical protein